MSVTDLKKLKYKYPDAEINELVALFKASVYKTLPITDFAGNNLVYMEIVAQVRMNAVKQLLTPQKSNDAFGLKAMGDEIASTFTIEISILHGTVLEKFCVVTPLWMRARAASMI